MIILILFILKIYITIEEENFYNIKNYIGSKDRGNLIRIFQNKKYFKR